MLSKADQPQGVAAVVSANVLRTVVLLFLRLTVGNTLRRQTDCRRLKQIWFNRKRTDIVRVRNFAPRSICQRFRSTNLWLVFQRRWATKTKSATDLCRTHGSSLAWKIQAKFDFDNQKLYPSLWLYLMGAQGNTTQKVYSTLGERLLALYSQQLPQSNLQEVMDVLKAEKTTIFFGTITSRAMLPLLQAWGQRRFWMWFQTPTVGKLKEHFTSDPKNCLVLLLTWNKVIRPLRSTN